MTKIYHYPLLKVESSMSNWRECLIKDVGEHSFPLIDAITQLLNGSYSLEEICGKLLSDGFKLGMIFAILQWLDKHGLLHESTANTMSNEEKEIYEVQFRMLSYIKEAGGIFFPPREGVALQLALKNSTVVIIGLGLSSTSLARSLARAGIGHIIIIYDVDRRDIITNQSPVGKDSGEFRGEMERINKFIKFSMIEHSEDLSSIVDNIVPTLLVYCPDEFNEILCEWYNKICLERTVPFLIYREKAFEVSIGPLIIPKETACYVCYDRRRKATLSEMERTMDSSNPSILRLNFPLAIDLLALEIIKFLTDIAEPISRGRIWQLNAINGRLGVHPVLKLPRCPACGIHKSKPLRKLWME